MITLLHPFWLVLLIPLAAAWWMWQPASRFLRYARLALLIFVMLALCGLAVRLPSRTGTIVVVVDRSLSMPQGSEALQKEAVEMIQHAMGADDRLAVVTFGETAAIERTPQTGAFAGFNTELRRDASNLHDALEKSLALIPQNTSGKIMVISDGRWSGRDPASAAARAAARGITIDYRSLQRSSANDLAISQVDAPVRVTPGEAFMMTAWVLSPTAQEISYELRRGNQTLSAGKFPTASGLNRLTFRDVAAAPGAQSYTIQITGNGTDPLPENNSARVIVGVQGPRPLLVVSSSANSGLARLLTTGGLNVKTLLPQQCDWSLESLAQYSAVLLENVSAEKISERGMENIAAWVTETGAGLMMTGGRNAYGPGGYFKSALDPILPVSMELRREHRKLALAIAIAMDRSGSMAVPVSGGRTKMDLANLAAVQVLDLLSPTDEFGVVAVDSVSHIIADIAQVSENKTAVRNSILKIDSGGGGIFVYEALTTAADMMLRAKAGTRHIILFADAADSEEPGQYEELLKECAQSGITVSVIGLGRETDVDADLLRDIAKRGGGQVFFTENPEELPRLFAQDTIVVARSTFVDQPTPVQFTGGMVALTGKQFASPPSPGGYNLCYLRPGANLAALTRDEYKAPFVASWQAGSGRVLGYTGEADGQYTGAIAGWKDAGEFLTSLARWTAGDTKDLPGNMMLTQEVRNGTSIIRLHLDPEAIAGAGNQNTPSIIESPIVTTLRGMPGAKPASEKSGMRWTAADTLETEVPLNGSETALSSVEIPGAGRVTLAPVTLPWSPEYKPAASEEGQLTLARMAQSTGGRERIELAGVWQDLPRKSRLIDLRPWLLFISLLLLLLEVLERHTGLVTMRLLPVWQKDRIIEKLKSPRREVKSQPAVIDTSAPEAIESGKQKEEAVKSETTAATPAAIADALRQARERAKSRTER